LAATVLAACGSDDGGRASTTPDPDVRETPSTTVPAPPPPASIQSVGDLDGATDGYETEATFDDTPMSMAVRAEDEDLVYVALRGGRLVRFDPSAGPDAQDGADTVLDFSGDVSTDSERGFLGVAFAPDGGHLYTSYTNPDGDTRIDEYAVT